MPSSVSHYVSLTLNQKQKGWCQRQERESPEVFAVVESVIIKLSD